MNPQVNCKETQDGVLCTFKFDEGMYKAVMFTEIAIETINLSEFASLGVDQAKFYLIKTHDMGFSANAKAAWNPCSQTLEIYISDDKRKTYTGEFSDCVLKANNDKFFE